MTTIARISQSSSGATQQGRAKSDRWVLECELESRRTPEALMGWISSADTMNQLRIPFETEAQAVTFAEKQGWTPIVQQASQRKLKPRNYLDNFKFEPFEQQGKPNKEPKKKSKTKTKPKKRAEKAASKLKTTTKKKKKKSTK